LTRNHWPAFKQALLRLHQPKVYDPEGFEIARQRLAYDEALAREMAMGQARLARERRFACAPSPAPSGPNATSSKRCPSSRPAPRWTPTPIVAIDMGRPVPMRRMIQGDVGSGKTLVAALAAAQVAADGGITALMSPTEVLARQQAEAIGRFLAPLGIRVAALTGRDKGAGREAILNDVRAGKIQVLSGTQALYQSDVDLPELSLVVIDEQHRFGVADRFKLTAKGASPHMLVMSATPSPAPWLSPSTATSISPSSARSPPTGRTSPPPPCPTRASTKSWPPSPVQLIAASALSGYARRRFRRRRRRLRDRSAAMYSRASCNAPVELVHGRMPGQDRDAALDKLRTGEAGVLVATTVIEVGVDVPEATIIVIEHAEKFGLAQLHQLRGRVGRGDKASSCLLLYQTPLTEGGKERLDILRKTTDGFEIAEADFKLRGPGDVLGLRQSGLPTFRVLNIVEDTNLIETARTDAKSVLMADPRLEGARGTAVRRARDLFAPRIASMVTDNE
jgi:ATP-dependent DNA helicase RecG